MATYISNGSGNWTTIPWLTAATGTLGPTAPAGAPPQSGGGDKIIIRGSHVVTYNVVGEFGDQTSAYTNNINTYAATIISNAIALSGNCVLKASRLTSTALSARGNIFIGLSATLDWGTLSDPLTGVNSTVTLHYQPTTMTQIGAAGIYLFGTGTNAEVGNSIYINGEEKTRHTFLTQNHANGATTLFVDSVSGWKIGDKLVVAVENPSLISSTTSGVLSSTIIQSIDTVARSVNISPPLNTARSAGRRVGNFSSNVVFQSFNPDFPSYGIIALPSYSANVLLNNFKIENLCSNDGWRTYAGAAVRTDVNSSLYYSPQYQNTPLNSLKGICFDLTPPSIGSRATVALRLNSPSYDTIKIENCVHYSFSQNLNNTFATIENLSLYDIVDCCSFFARTTMNYIGTFPANINITNSFFDYVNVFSSTTNGLNVSVQNSTIRGAGFLSSLEGIQNYNFRTCAIHLSGASPATLIQPSINSVGNISLVNCTLSGNSLIQPTTTLTSQKANIRINQLNNSEFDYRRYNSYYTAVLDLTARKNGSTSYKIKPNIANTIFKVFEYIPAIAGVPQRIKCNLKFDSAYGITNPPSISFVGTGVNQTFTCPAVADIWHDVDLTLNPTSTNDIEITIFGQSSNINGFVWLDGIPFVPFITDVRWYGFEFDKNFDRTVDTLTTLTENQASSVDITNLDRLYDASNYWTINNPLSTSYLDLYTKNGDILNFGNRNIVFDNSASTNVTYSSASNTVTIKTPLLSSGNNFIGLRTTGTITVSANSNFSYIDIYGNVSQPTPVSLSGVYMEGTLSYSTNLDTAIEYIDCTMDTVQNLSTGFITIKKTTSTITNGNDAEILDYVPTLIDIENMEDGSIAIFDNNGTRRYYQNAPADNIIVLPSTATGTWRYHIARYRFNFIQENFVVDGGTKTISPDYIPDNFVTGDSTTTAAYTDLNSTQRIYNYLSYYSTTSEGIEYDPFYDKAFGSITINKNVTLNATAASVFNYNGTSLVTLKCTSLTEDVLFVSSNNVTYINGTTLSDDVRVRAANLNSELLMSGVTTLTLYPTSGDRDDNTNIGEILTGTIYRFLYGSTTPLGVPLVNFLYNRVNVSGTILLNETAIVTGRNVLQFETTGTLQQIINNQKTINIGIQRASKLIPHTANI